MITIIMKELNSLITFLKDNYNNITIGKCQEYF